jgi:hypothetical protein
MGILTMELKQFLSEYGKHIKSHKKYDNGTIMLKFAPSNGHCVMWLKRIVAEKLDMSVKASNVTSKTYWFE